jgi:hypothetical protein
MQSEGRRVKARRAVTVQQELFATDPWPEVRRQLTEILNLLK